MLGKTKRTPSPDCPKDTARHPCEGVGSVTGFPLVAGGEKRPMNVRRERQARRLGDRPLEAQEVAAGLLRRRCSESDKFGKTPTARIAVIKHRKRHDYKLLRQSPVVKLSGALGRKQVFTLDKPLQDQEGPGGRAHRPDLGVELRQPHQPAQEPVAGEPIAAQLRAEEQRRRAT